VRVDSAESVLLIGGMAISRGGRRAAGVLIADGADALKMSVLFLFEDCCDVFKAPGLVVFQVGSDKLDG